MSGRVASHAGLPGVAAPAGLSVRSRWRQAALLSLAGTAVWAPLAQGSAFDGGRAGLLVLTAITVLTFTQAAARGEVPARPGVWGGVTLALIGWILLGAFQAQESFGAQQQGALLIGALLLGLSARALLTDPLVRARFGALLCGVVGVMAAAVVLQRLTGGFTLRADPAAATGLYYHPSHYAGFVTLALPVAVWGLTTGGHASWKRRSRLTLRAVGGVSAVILAASLAFTHSSSLPTALLALGLAVSAALWRWHRWAGAAALSVLLLGAATGAWLLGSDEGQRRLDRLMGGTQTKSVSRFLQERQALWTIDRQAAANAGVLGVGPGNFIHVAPQYRPARATGSNDHAFGFVNYAHNDYYQVAVEHGRTGVTLYLLILLLTLWTPLRALRDGRQMDALAVAALCGLLPLWIAGIWDGNATVVPGTVAWAWLLMGLVVSGVHGRHGARMNDLTREVNPR